ncbi:MAG: site-specific integrase [Rhizobiaceae bacterium]|nr:site-specific integrase [Rhizobiaceae bacterium]MCZ8349860.1 site-specific integrase [Rhizobium sp.]
MTKITKRTVDALMSQPVGSVLRDDDLKGFQARRISSGITFAFEYRAGSGRAAPVKRIAIGRFGSLAPDEARKIAKDHAVAVAGGKDPAAEKAREKGIPRLIDFATAYLDDCEEIATSHPESAKLRTGSIRSYRSLLNVHIGPALGKRTLDKIDSDDVERLHKAISKEKPATANRCLELIGTIYRQAVIARHVPKGTNPASGITANKERKRERFLSPEELSRLGEAIRTAETDGLPYSPPEPKPGKKAKHIPKALPPYVIDAYSAAALRLLIFSGARLREVLHAKWTDIDFGRGLLTVFGKTGRRHIVLPAPALEIINGLERAGEYVIASTDPTKPKADLARPWAAVCKLAGLDDVRIHDLRHSFASVAVSGGASLPMIGKLLGHSQAQTTARYAHLADDPVRAAAERAAGVIAGAMAGASGNVVPMLAGDAA